MKLKKKMLILFLCMLILPIFVCYIGILAVGLTQMRAIEKIGDKNFGDIFSSVTVQIIDNMLRENEEQIDRMIEEDPDQFLNVQTVASVNQEFSANFSHLVVLQGEEILYNGYYQDNLSWLPQARESLAQAGDDHVVMFYNRQLIRGSGVDFSDGSTGAVFCVAGTNTLLAQLQSTILQFFILVILIMVLVAILVSAWLHQMIISPLRELQKATGEIKNGNLNYALDVSDAEQSEIGDLMRDFEEMRIRLKDSQEEKIRFDADSKSLISNISHDLKTPVTTIKGYAEGILDGVASSPERMEKYIRTIYNKANDMDKLIDELTLYTKIDTNRIPYAFTKLDISEYFRDCVDEMGPELEEKHVDLGFFNYLEDHVLVIADPEQLRRVVNNIVGNSVKYLDKGRGIINIRLKDVGDFVQVEIEDNGKGIAAKDLPYIFDRFYRTDSSRTSATGGSGIGLSIVKKIVEDHGGRIWATSKENIGTVLCFVLRKYQDSIAVDVPNS